MVPHRICIYSRNSNGTLHHACKKGRKPVPTLADVADAPRTNWQVGTENRVTAGKRIRTSVGSGVPCILLMQRVFKLRANVIWA